MKLAVVTGWVGGWVERVNNLGPTLNSQSKKPGGLADDAAIDYLLQFGLWKVLRSTTPINVAPTTLTEVYATAASLTCTVFARPW